MLFSHEIIAKKLVRDHRTGPNNSGVEQVPFDFR